MSQSIIEIPDRESVEREHSSLVEQAKAFRVIDVATHKAAKEIFKSLVAREKAIDARMDPLCEAAHKTHKGLTTLRNDFKDPVTAAKKVIEAEIIRYDDEERKKAEALQRELSEKARRAEEDRALADACEADAAGDKAGAESILDAAAVADAPSIKVEANVAKVAGVSSRATWSAEVVDKKALVAYVAKNLEWISLLEPNLTALNKLASAQKADLQIPGVKAVEKKSLSGRSV